MANSRVPQTIPEFNNYINTTDDYLLAGTPTTNRERLGLTVQNGNDWHAKRVYWRDTLYPKYIDPLQSTSAVKDEVRIFMKEFSDFARPLLNIMVADSDANSDDENVFHFKIERAEPSVPTTAITDAVVYQHRSLVGGLVEFACRPENDSKNPSKHPQSDSIQMASQIQGDSTPPQEFPNPNNTTMTMDLFTKAVFVKDFGVENKGKVVLAYLRWCNTKRPNLNGPWTGPIAIGLA